MKASFLLPLLLIGGLSIVLVSAARFDIGQLQQVFKVGGESDGKKVPGNSELRLCREGQEWEDSAVVENVELKPYPPVPGENLTITASGFVRDPIKQGARVDVLVKMFSITLIKQSFDLCEQSDSQLNITCPIPEGPLEIVKEVKIPSVIPPGKIKVTADVFNDDESRITCLKGEIEFHKG